MQGDHRHRRGQEAHLPGQSVHDPRHACSGVAMAIKPTLLEDGLPWIGVSANPKLTTPTVPNMFHVTYTGVYSGQAMAGCALSKPNTKRVVLVAHTNDWARGYCDPATELMKEKGVEPMM